MMRWAVVTLLLLCSCATPRANFPLFGGGPFVNFSLGDTTQLAGPNDNAVTNASAHVGWSVAFAAGGYAWRGRKGMLLSCTAWSTGTLIQETFFHGAASAPEFRADLLTRIAPCFALTGLAYLLDW